MGSDIYQCCVLVEEAEVSVEGGIQPCGLVADNLRAYWPAVPAFAAAL